MRKDGYIGLISPLFLFRLSIFKNQIAKNKIFLKKVLTNR